MSDSRYVLVGRNGERLRLQTGDRFKIGRNPKNDLIIPDREVSREHASITVQEDNRPNGYAVYLTDLGSTNGTYLDGERIQGNLGKEIFPGNYITFSSPHNGHVYSLKLDDEV